MKIVVLAGGLSPERDVSLSSGSLIANALREAGHRVVLLDVYEGIAANENGLEVLFKDKITGAPYNYKVPEKEPDLDEIKRRTDNGNSLIGKNILPVCRLADVVFIALHGAMGENGQIQAVFDVIGIKYTGTGYAGSLLAMDKDLTKKLLLQASIPTAKWLVCDGSGMDTQKIINRIGLPCVVKPCSGGSSIGVSIVGSADALREAVAAAGSVEETVMVEEMIPGREFSVGILEGRALPVIEIIPREGFYDYKNKYQAGLTDEICPARLTEAEREKIQDYALRIHKLLRLGTYSRMDFILDASGEFICLEANTLPGMTPTSLIPQEALAEGISYVELCSRIAGSAAR